MAEWSNAAVLKTVMGVSPSGVRIPLPPLNNWLLVREIRSPGPCARPNAHQGLCYFCWFTNGNHGEVPEWLIGAAC